VKGHIYPNFLNEVVRFPPIFMNVDIKTDEKTIGPSMCEYVVKNNMKVDTKECKLTQLTDTHDKYRLTNNYMLWFLIDICHFIIDDIRIIYVYEKHTGFRSFTEEMTKLRQRAKLHGDGAGDEFYKLVLNGSYGYDIMNEEKFCKTCIVRRETAKLKVFSPYFMSARLLNTNCYQAQMEKESFNCKTPLIQGFFTLENAKFWYLNFIYNFIQMLRYD
jgi:hypothetical protein